jgi:phosphoribosylglycinamide formyltransferase-1
MLSIVVLISGSGTNLKALIDASELESAQFIIKGVVSNNSNAAGLALAREHKIATTVIERSSFGTLKEHKDAVLASVESHKPELVVLAGFMMVLHESFVNAFAGRIINIHPSLLPLYPGLHTHERAIADRAKIHGCTVHIVDTGVDTGAIIAQAKVEVPSDVTPETLKSLVQKREWELYPWVVTCIATQEITIADGSVLFSENAKRAAIKKNIMFPLTP